MKNALKKINNVYIWAGLLAALFFCLIYGVHVLDPFNVDWFYSHHDDVAQHFLGWNAYRHSPWAFPFGNFNKLSYPQYVSVVFTDSIPGLAFVCKLISPLIHCDFQYFGLMNLLSFILMALMTVRLLSSFTDNKPLILFTSLLCLMLPVFIYRVLKHTALAHQWILLFALEPLLNFKKYTQDTKRLFLHFSFIALFSACVHMYYAPMCFLMLLGFIVSDMIYEKRFFRSAILIVLYGAITIVVTALFGGFTPGLESSGSGLEKYGINLNSFLNPGNGWSALIKDLPSYDQGQLGGVYFGAGCILLIILSLFVFFQNTDFKVFFKDHRFEITALGVCFITSFLMALLPLVSLGDRVLFTLPLPPSLYRLWSVFRGHDRFFWVCIYMLVLLAALILSRYTRKRLAAFAMAFCLFLQIFDISPKLIEKHTEWFPYETHENNLEASVFWNRIGKDERILHFVYSSTKNRVDNTTLCNVAEWAVDNGKTTNDFYFARSLDRSVFEENLKSSLADSEGNIYLFSKADALELMPYDINYYIGDGFITGTKYDIEGFTPMTRDEVEKILSSEKAEELW